MKIQDGFVGQRFLALSPSYIDELCENPLTSSLYVVSLGHFPHAQYHYIQRTQGIDDHILLYCTSGKGNVTIGNRSMPLSANQFVIIPAATPHTYSSNPNTPWSIYWVHFRGNNAASLVKGFDLPHDIADADNSRMAERNSIFDEMYSLLDGSLDAAHLHYSCILLQHYLASFIYLDIFRPSLAASSSTTTHSTTITRKMIHYLNEHIDQQVSMSELEQLSGYSRSYLYRMFIQEVGESPKDYFIRKKMNRACYLLTHTNLTISQISLILAFSETQYFARTFRKVMNITASEYRQKNR